MRVTFQRTLGDEVIHELTVPAQSRRVVWTGAITGVPAAFATDVIFTNGAGIVVERSLYWPGTTWAVITPWACVVSPRS